MSSEPVVFDASYFDGDSAQRQHVRVRASTDGLEITSGDGAEPARWPITHLRWVDPPHSDQPLRLASAKAGDARLIVDDSTARAWLQRHVPKQSRGMAIIGLTIAAAAVAATLAAFLWFGVPAVSRPLAFWLPADWLTSFGNDLRERLAESDHSIVCTTPAGAAALTALQEAIGGRAAGGLPISVTVVKNPMANAMALPGGQILLLSGLLRHAESAAEVAGVLAHEVGHVAHRHPTQRLIQVVGATALIDLFIGGSGVTETIASAGGVLLFLSYTRDMEHEADTFAHIRLQETGIGERGLKRLFERLNNRRTNPRSGDNNWGAYLSSHPTIGERVAAMSDAPATAKALNETQWQALQQICD